MRERVILAPHGPLSSSDCLGPTCPMRPGRGSRSPRLETVRLTPARRRNTATPRRSGYTRAFAPGDENSGIIEVQTVAAASNLENKDALPAAPSLLRLKGPGVGLCRVGQVGY